MVIIAMNRLPGPCKMEIKWKSFIMSYDIGKKDCIY